MKISGEKAGRLSRVARSSGAKPFLIVLLVLLFLIPVSMIKNLVGDREFYRDEALRSILLPKGGEPVLQGFALALPYIDRAEERTGDGRTVLRESVRHLLCVPEQWKLSAAVEPEILTRGIFDVPVFECAVQSEGNFAPAPTEHFNLKEENILWDEALLLVGISDKKNFCAEPEIETDGGRILERSIAEPDVSPFTRTVFYRLTESEARGGFSFSAVVMLQGGESVSFVPMAADNRFEIRGTWDTPAFTGGWLPSERELSGEGFFASWRVPGLATSFPEAWLSGMGGDRQMKESGMFDDSRCVRTEFLSPVDHYQKTSRSVKYAALFLLVPFLAVFIFEIFTRVKIHPVQYCLIGLADVLFYLLLLSLSEHLGFGKSYWIAAAAVCAVSLGYTSAIFKSVRWGALFAAAQAVSYVFLFGTLQAEDYALLLGTLGLFCVVVLLMVLTRRIDWYALAPEESGDGD